MYLYMLDWFVVHITTKITEEKNKIKYPAAVNKEHSNLGFNEHDLFLLRLLQYMQRSIDCGFSMFSHMNSITYLCI